MSIHDRRSGNGFVVERCMGLLSLDYFLLWLVLVYGISLIGLFLNCMLRVLSLYGTTKIVPSDYCNMKCSTYVTLLPYLSTSVTTVSGPASVSCQV